MGCLCKQRQTHLPHLPHLTSQIHHSMRPSLIKLPAAQLAKVSIQTIHWLAAGWDQAQRLNVKSKVNSKVALAAMLRAPLVATPTGWNSQAKCVPKTTSMRQIYRTRVT
jgi:hypothetical protein